jgi:hypothetical protein
MQFAIGGARDLAVVGFEDDRRLVAVAVLDIAVEAVVRCVQLTVREPFVKRRIRFVEGLGERFVPGDVFARQACPEAFVVAGGFVAQLPVCIHAGDGGIRCELRGRLEHAMFLQALLLIGLVLGHASLHSSNVLPHTLGPHAY